MPNSILEAMASQKPVVATRAEGVEELLGSDMPSQIVDFGDEIGLVDRIQGIMTASINHRAALGQRNRQRIAAHFGLERMVEQYETLYTELLRRPEGP
jgi:glycosyltransferase involved in cell wall biosynthesis